MAKTRILLAGAALAASGLQALAATPQPATPIEPATVAGVSGLTAADLIVGRDGRVAVDVHAREVKVADASNSGSC